MGGGKGQGQTKTATNGANNLGQTAAGAAGQAGQTAGQFAGIQNTARSTAQPFVNSLIPSQSGALSPYAAAQYAQAKNNIDKTYQGQAQAALRGAAARGFGAPTGQTASIANTAGQNQGAAETNAFQGAQQNTLGQGLQGINYLQNQQQIYNPLSALNTQAGLIDVGQKAFGEGIQGGKALNSESGLLNSIGAGLGTLAQGAALAG